jgi:DNA-3-methyladenine glycosylase I
MAGAMLQKTDCTAGADMKKSVIHRCPWVDLTKPDYVAYHDVEWGVPVHDDRRLFEFLILEGAQAGLSWYTVLRKRDNYRSAFDHFDPAKVARYDERKVRELLGNAGIIRNKAKIGAAINNARKFLEIQDTFGSFDAYSWKFVEGTPIVHAFKRLRDYPATSRESDAMSKDLRQRGFTFVGSTVCYAHMQATGMVNDHTMTCVRRQEIIKGYSPQSSQRMAGRTGKKRKIMAITSTRKP